MGRAILSPEFIRTATRPTDLPAPYPYYGFYWGSNAKGQLADMPRDVYWALGLGESILVVCPSLDIVAVRLGTGSTRSQLPPFTNDWDKKVEGFFRLVARAVSEPYPPSTVISGSDLGPREHDRAQSPGQRQLASDLGRRRPSLHRLRRRHGVCAQGARKAEPGTGPDRRRPRRLSTGSTFVRRPLSARATAKTA